MSESESEGTNARFGDRNWCPAEACSGLGEDGMCGMGLGRSCEGFLTLDVGTISGEFTCELSADEWAVFTEHTVISPEAGKP